MKNIFLPGILAALTGCASPSPAPSTPIPGPVKPAPPTMRYDDDRDDELDHDLSRRGTVTGFAALC